MVSLRASWRWGVLHRSFMFCQKLLSTMSEFTPRAAGGFILNGGRCDPMDMWWCRGTDKEGRLTSSSLPEQTNDGKHLVPRAVKPSRLMVIVQDCEDLLTSSPTWWMVEFASLKGPVELVYQHINIRTSSSWTARMSRSDSKEKLVDLRWEDKSAFVIWWVGRHHLSLWVKMLWFQENQTVSKPEDAWPSRAEQHDWSES